MKKTIFVFLIACGGATCIRAQSMAPATLNATGGTAILGSNEFEWSVGEMTMVSTFSSSGIIVTQGMLQPYDGPSGVINTKLLTNLNVFPNPASSIVNLQYTSGIQGALVYRLMDVTGKVIKTSTVAITQGTTTEQINISGLANATYMLEVMIRSGNGASETTSYKIQKIN